MSDLIRSWTGVTALVGVIAFLIFVLPTPQWMGWPALAIAIAALGRLILVGERRHLQLRSRLNIDEDTDESSRKAQILDLLKSEQQKDRRR